MIDLLIGVAILFAFGMLVITVGKILKGIVTFAFIVILGAFVWFRVMPQYFGEEETARIGDAAQALLDGEEPVRAVPSFDDAQPVMPVMPKVELADAFAIKPEIEKYVFSSLDDKIAAFKAKMDAAGETVVPPDLPESAEAFELLSDENKRRLKDAVMRLFAEAPVATVDVPPVARAETTVLAYGDFVAPEDDSRDATGVALIEKRPDAKPVLRLEEFSVTPGPDLMVLLCISPVGDVNVGYVSLGPLKAEEGNQNYTITTKASLTGFRSVVIYSDTLETAYAVAPLDR